MAQYQNHSEPNKYPTYQNTYIFVYFSAPPKKKRRRMKVNTTIKVYDGEMFKYKASDPKVLF